MGWASTPEELGTVEEGEVAARDRGRRIGGGEARWTAAPRRGHGSREVGRASCRERVYDDV